MTPRQKLLLGTLIMLVPMLAGWAHHVKTNKASSFRTDPFTLSNTYVSYREDKIVDRRFSMSRHSEILHQIGNSKGFILDTLGYSVESRPIYAVKWGNGPKKVLLWSQMHGDEPTATMALLDLFHFLKEDQQFKDFRKLLSDSLELIFIPCLNPDGAVCYQRRNAMDIDINRDAVELKSPEARILKDVFDTFHPHWAVNLHDQSPYYTSDGISREVYFSFQVPPVDETGTVSGSMIPAGELLGALIGDLQEVLGPGHIAKYPVRYAQNAFGESFQQRAVPTILIESGFKRGDTEKQWLRQQHWLLLVKLIEHIAAWNQASEKDDTGKYYQLEECSITYHDIIIEHVTIPFKKGNKTADVGIRRLWKACSPEGALRTVGYIGRIGEPFSLKGDHYLNGKYYQWTPSKLYPDSLAEIQELFELNLSELVKEGYVQFRMRSGPDTCLIDPSFPLAINSQSWTHPKEGQPLSFFLKSQGGGASYLFHNGYIHDLDSISNDYCRKFLNLPFHEKDN